MNITARGRGVPWGVGLQGGKKPPSSSQRGTRRCQAHSLHAHTRPCVPPPLGPAHLRPPRRLDLGPAPPSIFFSEDARRVSPSRSSR